MRPKVLKYRVKGELLTETVGNSVEKKNIQAKSCYKQSVFVRLVVF